MAITTIKIHPAIGIARLGNSDEYFIGPELTGDTSAPPGGYKDANCLLKKQAARFRLFAYDATGTLVQEITAADATIQWTVHLANRKGAGDLFVGAYDPNQNQGQRNESVGNRSALVIDPGPRSITGVGGSQSFDTGTFLGQVVPLGEMRTDTLGRLLILGGNGSSGSPINAPLQGVGLNGFANHDGWYDDVSDGPITATVTLNGTNIAIDAAPAWVICAPPRYAPGILPVISLYDILFQIAVDKGWLTAPGTPSFNNDIFPVIDRAMKIARLFDFSTQGADHSSLAGVIPPPGPQALRQTLFNILRDPALPPTTPSTSSDMPKIWSDAFQIPSVNETSAALTKVQYAAMKQWAAGTFTNDWTGSPPPPATNLTPDGLDRAALEHCIGAGFCPGIEASWQMRDKFAYTEPFRLEHAGRQAGDVTQQMALPWQADFVDCSDGDVASNGELLLWWPTHRPLSVFPEGGGPQVRWARALVEGNGDVVLNLISNFHKLGFVVDKGGQLVETEREVVCQTVTFLMVRPTVGQDEVDARRPPMGSAVIAGAFRVVVDGFAAGDLGINSPAGTLNVPSPVGGLQIRCTGNVAEAGAYGSGAQRFTFSYNLDFGADDSAFNGVGPSGELFDVSATVQGVTGSAQLQLLTQADPFLLHGDPPWLSIDLRVFHLKEGDPKFGVTMGSDPNQFIGQVLGALNTGQGSAGGETFENDLTTGEEGKSTLATATQDLPPPWGTGKKLYNFAVARVHYIGVGGANDVRVFFRLFSAQTTTGAFDLNGAYKRTANPLGQPIPLPGIVDVDYVTIPCFADPRVTPANAAKLSDQTDETNRLHFDGGNPKEQYRFFGCWLDINQDTPVLPAVVPPTNPYGPFNLGAPFQPVSVRDAILRNSHQCLIAEIAFDPAPIPPGKDPGNWDKLAQRNLAFSPVPNPGAEAGSRRALDTFEIRPTPLGLRPDQPVDELMIDWPHLPHGTVAQLYLPSLDADQVLNLANHLYANHQLKRIDDHTIECPASGLTWVPVPPKGLANHVGLLSIELPPGIRRGQAFQVVVQQVTNAYGKPSQPPPRVTAGARGRRARAHAEAAPQAHPAAGTTPRLLQWRRVLGSFQLQIPVKTKEEILLPDERLLSVLRWVQRSIPVTNRWFPVFVRLLEQLGQRIAGAGGDPALVPPSPLGLPEPKLLHPHRPHRGPEERCEERLSATGKVAGLFYDRFGDFCGFLLDTEDGQRRYECRESHLAALAGRALHERVPLTVWSERDSPHLVLSILLHQPPVGP